MTTGSKTGSSASDGEHDTALEELGFDTDLFEKLKALRNEIAASEGVPAYVVFNNKTLEFFTRLRPTTVLAGSRIRGVGEVKVEKYLPAFIDVIVEHGE